MSEAASIQYDDDAPVEAVESQEVESQEVDETPVEDVQDDAESAESDEETTEEAPEPVRNTAPEFTPEQQEYINNHITARMRARLTAAEQRAAELEEIANQVKQQQPQNVDQDGAPVVPPMPEDIWADDYEERVKQRDEAIANRARWETDQQIRQQWEQHQQQQRLEESQKAVETKVKDYSKRATSLGIESNALQIAGNTVAQVGVTDYVAEYILQDESGPAITMYLAKNLGELANMQSMNPMQAAVHIEKRIKPNALRSVKAKTNLPEPTETVKGSGVREKQRGPQGATYE
jgi:hypothetical protein